MNRILGPHEILQKGDLAITDDGGEPVALNGWESIYFTPENIMSSPKTFLNRNFKIIRVERGDKDVYMKLHRTLELNEVTREGDIAITDKGVRIVVNGWAGMTVYQLSREPRRDKRETHNIVSVIRLNSIDTNELLRGLEKIRQELWTSDY